MGPCLDGDGKKSSKLNWPKFGVDDVLDDIMLMKPLV